MKYETKECPELASAIELAPKIAANAIHFEKERRISPGIAESMTKAGLIQMAIPKEYGGLESHLIEILAVIEEISYGDASAGWCLMNYQTTALLAGMLQAHRAEEIFNGPEYAVPAGVLAPTAQGKFVDGGMLVNGRWRFASGCDNANWLMGSVLMVDDNEKQLYDKDGNQLLLFPWFTREQFTIIDTWNVSGLRGSGSHDVEVLNGFVPENRWLALDDPLSVNGTLFRFPLISTFPPAVAAVSIGTARAALDYFTELAKSKVPAAGSTPICQIGYVQSAVSKAEALIDSARSYVYTVVDSLWTTVDKGIPATIEARRRIRLAGSHAAAMAADSVDLLYNAAGSSSIAEDCPLQRYFRDVHVTTQHHHVNGGEMERMGRLRLTGDIDGLL
ncbi:MAG: acyl-CoA dehydrogenase family protein [Pseudomonadota bacterium]|nr:acyl-CoA dehydrogenase family protein [Pseudomonadota bacterium]